MTTTNYTRTKLVQFIQQTISMNKSKGMYFDLLNNDKLFIDLKATNGSTKVYLISESRLKKDIFLGEANLRDFKGITLFANYIDSLLDKHKVKKESFIIDINNIENQFNSNDSIDFDNI